MPGGLVVVGGGIAAQSVVEEVRKLDERTPVTILSAEKRLPYDRVRLSQLMANGDGAEALSLRTSEWYRDNSVRTVLGAYVNEIDRDSRRVVTADGEAFSFDRLCLATGSDPLIPPIAGIDKEGVFPFRTPEDCAAIREAVGRGSRGAVIGGGLLGLEAARGLVEAGAQVSVVHLVDRLMERQLDAGAAGFLAEAMSNLDVAVLLERATAEVLGNGRVTGLRFATGEELGCDFVVVGVGIKPKIDLARASGLTCERGIVVDDFMRASDPAIFAVGECAEHRGTVYGVVGPISEQASVAARAMVTGGDAVYGGSIISTKLKVMGVDLVTVGAIEGDRTAVVERRDEGVYRKLVLSEGRVVGAILMGDTRGYEVVGEWVRSGRTVEEPLDALAEASALGPADLPDQTQVCNCNGVCKKEIVDAVRVGGLGSAMEVMEVTRAGTGCGSCKPLVRDLVALECGADGEEPAYLCPCKRLTGPDIAAVVRERGLEAVSDVQRVCGAGKECGACKPGIAYLVSEINDNRHREERAARFINDRVHANIQKDGTFSVVPRIYGGVTSPAELRKIADVAERHEVPMVKITGGQRIDLLGVKKEQLPGIWEELGMPSGHAYAKAVRTVKTCVGRDFCRFGLGESIGLGIELERLWEGLYTPHKVKAAVSGCPRNCSEASTKDIGLTAVEGGWQVMIGGAAGSTVRRGDILATVDDKEEAIRVATTFLQYYRENGNYLERTHAFVERVGLATIAEAVLDEESGSPERLRERLRLAKAAATDPWLERRVPVHPKQFAELDSAPDFDPAEAPACEPRRARQAAGCRGTAR